MTDELKAKTKIVLTPENKAMLAYIQDQLHRVSGEIRADVARLEANFKQTRPAAASAIGGVVDSEAITLNDLGVQLFYRNEVQESRSVLERATQSDPNLLEAWNNLAMVCSALGEAEQAGEAFARAIALDANRTEVLCNQAVLHLIGGDNEAALTLLERAEQTHPRHIPTLLNLAHVYQLKGEHERAVRAWKMVVVIDPANEEAKQNLRQYFQ